MSKTVERTPLFSKKRAQRRPDMPPPIIATTGSSETGAVNLTCSWMNVFFKTDLLEELYFLLRNGAFLLLVVLQSIVVVIEWNGEWQGFVSFRGWIVSIILLVQICRETKMSSVFPYPYSLVTQVPARIKNLFIPLTERERCAGSGN